MSNSERPLTAWTSRGWEVAHYSSTVDPATSMLIHCFHLARQGQSMIVTVRKKMLGEGVITEDFEV